MDFNWEYPGLKEDEYRLSKEGLQGVLSNFGLKYKEDDSEVELRSIVKTLNKVIESNKTRADKDRFVNLVKRKLYLPEGALQTYPDLAQIQSFLENRDHLYDRAETNSEESDDGEEPSLEQSFRVFRTAK